MTGSSSYNTSQEEEQRKRKAKPYANKQVKESKPSNEDLEAEKAALLDRIIVLNNQITRSKLLVSKVDSSDTQNEQTKKLTINIDDTPASQSTSTGSGADRSFSASESSDESLLLVSLTDSESDTEPSPHKKYKSRSADNITTCSNIAPRRKARAHKSFSDSLDDRIQENKRSVTSSQSLTPSRLVVSSFRHLDSKEGLRRIHDNLDIIDKFKRRVVSDIPCFKSYTCSEIFASLENQLLEQEDEIRVRESSECGCAVIRDMIVGGTNTSGGLLVVGGLGGLKGRVREEVGEQSVKQEKVDEEYSRRD